MLASIEGNLSLELSKFRCLPFYLAILYLRTSKSPTAFIRRGDLVITYKAKQNCYILKNIATEFKKLWVGKDHILPGGTYEMHDQWEHTHDPLKHEFDVAHNLIDPYSTTFTTDVQGLQQRGHLKKLQKTHIYSRNKNLINLINTTVDLYLKDKGNIPPYLIFPYLFFNQPNYLSIIEDPKTKTKDRYYREVFLKYDHYNQSLRMKEGQRGSKYTALSRNDLFNAFYDTTATTAPVGFSYTKRSILPDRLTQTPEFSGVYDQYYKKAP